MKRFICLLISIWLLPFAKAQTLINISTDKTTSLVFPFGIAHVDRGSESVLAQQVKEMSTILLVKAASKDFRETNLSVVTEDGSLYSFLVRYAPNPAEWVFHLQANQNTTIAGYANNIIDNPSTVFRIRDYSWNVVARVKGIYIKDDILYYQLSIENKTPIDYTIDLIKFSIRDKKKGKRTALQENELTPKYIAGNTTLVKANSETEFVFAMDKFTIPDAKYLSVQIMEKNGGRHLNMTIKNKNIMKAIPLPDLRNGISQ
jgi:conjugative transposon TraN protein